MKNNALTTGFRNAKFFQFCQLRALPHRKAECRPVEKLAALVKL
jgi:hypothetical protein